MGARTDKLHGLELVPDGKKIGDVCATFANVEKEIHIGERSKVCASCRKPFNAVRKARKEIRLHAVDLSIPVAWAYPICGACAVSTGAATKAGMAFWHPLKPFTLAKGPRNDR